VLYISSSAAYPTGLQRGDQNLGFPFMGRRYSATALSESDIDLADVDQPDAGYGWLKLTGERMAVDADAAGLPTHIVRPFSGYGETQGENWPFGAFASRVKRREDPFTICGDGTQVRDWIHVSDVVGGALAVVEQDVREPVNLCTGVGTSMAELVGLFCSEVGYAPDIELRTDRPAGVAYRVGDPKRLHGIYKPQVSLEEGVARAVAA
jgi:nucleoside-diphosphate-sugar epimerase